MICFSRLILFSFIAIILAGCSDEPGSPASEEARIRPVVNVAEIELWQGQDGVELPGVVRPGKRAVISTRVAGTLLTVNADPGDRVKSGDLLATVDARQITAAISAARAKATASESAVEQAKLDTERLRQLYEEDLIARVRLERAQVRLQELQATLQAARSELAAQKANLSYTRLTAPFDGQVAEVPADTGSFVGPGQPLMVLEDRQQLRIDVPVSRQIADSLDPGQPVSVIVGDGRPLLNARLQGIIPALQEPGTGQRLRLTLDEHTEVLAPGQVVSVLVPRSNRQGQDAEDNWLGLPKAALIRRGQLTGTLVVKRPDSGDPEVHLTWISIATPPASNNRLVPVTRGLQQGDQVVLNPSAELQDGQQVTVRLRSDKTRDF